MDVSTQEQRDQIIDQLEQLNANVQRQLSLRHILFTGLVYGLSFAIGSTVLFAIVTKLILHVAGA